jgi:hypothetical protein
MKKTPLLQKVHEARSFFLIVIMSTTLLVHLFLFLLGTFVLRPYVFPVLEPEGLRYAKMLYLTAWIILPVLAIFYVIKKRILGKVMIYLGKIFKKIMEYYERKELRKQQKEMGEIEELRERYVITDITCIEQPYVFLLSLSRPIETNPLKPIPLLPYVTVNGTRVAVKQAGRNTLYCYARKALRAEDKKLSIRIGKQMECSIKNPYYLDSTCQLPINWQCEGHTEERNIFIPIDYFPNATKHAVYRFKLKVHKTEYGTFIGKYIPERNYIFVHLGKIIHRSDCTGKQAKLLLEYGKENQILLSEPKLMVRDGKSLL